LKIEEATKLQQNKDSRQKRLSISLDKQAEEKIEIQQTTNQPLNLKVIEEELPDIQD
jgi:hypothetical protein